jgi:peptide/nickel transport system substrate-binding protein/oligopeptide transport system substrate-binding protein
LQEVDLAFYKTGEASYSAYGSSQLDWTTIPAADLTQAKTKTKEFHKYNELSIDYIALNFLYKPLDNIDIRKALELSLNKDAILSGITKGARLPTCHIVPEGQYGYDPTLTCPDGTSTKGDTVKAKALFAKGLAAEGLTAATFPTFQFTYASGSTSLANQVTTIIQDWKQVLGITVTPQVVDFNTRLNLENQTTCQETDLTKCLNKGLSIWFAAWGADYPDPQDWVSLQFDKGQANNNWNYGQNLSTVASEQVANQKLMEQADVDLGSDRVALYNKAEQALVNDVAWLSWDQRTFPYLQKPYVYGTVDNAITQVPPDDWGNVYIAVH